MRNDFEKALYFRHACKMFDEQKKVSDLDINFILEAGRLSPSSFGLEHWHFLVIRNDIIKKKLQPFCWNQPQITTCSDFVVLLARRETFFTPQSDYLDQSFDKKVGGNHELKEKRKKIFFNFLTHELKPDVLNWSKMQCYLASGNMMSAAAYIGIDSCPIEGFAYDPFEEALAQEVPTYNQKDYAVAYALCFGYRKNEQPNKLRLSFDDVVTFVN